MVTSRRYLIASSLARLVRKERGGNRVTEGHFPNQADRSSFVVVEGDKGSLVLVHASSGGPIEERTEVPRAHAEALLDVTPGKLDYLLTHLTVGTRDIQVLRFVTPGPLDLISVSFESEDEARDFRPLSWFGADVTTEVPYQNRSIALEGAPQAPDVPMSNAALNSLLDALENRYVAPRGYTAHHAPARNQAEQGGGQRNAPPPPPPAAQAGERSAAPQRGVLSRPAAPADDDMHDDDNNDDNDLNLNIEDNVIRELARSLRPQRR
jgi:CYTH domain-containing protein